MSSPEKKEDQTIRNQENPKAAEQDSSASVGNRVNIKEEKPSSQNADPTTAFTDGVNPIHVIV